MSRLPEDPHAPVLAALIKLTEDVLAVVHRDCLRADHDRVRVSEAYALPEDLEEMIDKANLCGEWPDEQDLAGMIMAQPTPRERCEALVAVLAGLLARIEGQR